MSLTHQGEGLPKGVFAFVLVIIASLLSMLDPVSKEPVSGALFFTLTMGVILFFSRQVAAGMAFCQIIGTSLILAAVYIGAPTRIVFCIVVYGELITFVYLFRNFFRRDEKDTGAI